MIRVAFTMIGGKNWTGGYNYLLNLVRALCEYAPGRVQPVLFLGNDIDESDATPFELIPGSMVIRSDAFNISMKGLRFRHSVLRGCDKIALEAFLESKIDVVFEAAQFYGWRFPIPAIAWIPDFQHRYLPKLFSFKAFCKRDLGFRAQILSGRYIMLSSEDARQDCVRFYPVASNRTHVVRFAVPALVAIDAVAARVVADGYGLPDSFFFLPNQFWGHKNHECVIKALEILRKRGRSVTVAASGKQADPRDPAHFLRLKLIIESAGLEQQFRLLGLIPHSHISALMRSCEALINPSKFEGWSTTVEEAKSMGTPMILSSLRVHREQCDQALFFDPNSPSQLANILGNFSSVDAEDRLAMNSAAVRLASSSMKNFADDFVELMKLSAELS